MTMNGAQALKTNAVMTMPARSCPQTTDAGRMVVT